MQLWWVEFTLLLQRGGQAVPAPISTRASNATAKQVPTYHSNHFIQHICASSAVVVNCCGDALSLRREKCSNAANLSATDRGGAPLLI